MRSYKYDLMVTAGRYRLASDACTMCASVVRTTVSRAVCMLAEAAVLAVHFLAGVILGAVYGDKQISRNRTRPLELTGRAELHEEGGGVLGAALFQPPLEVKKRRALGEKHRERPQGHVPDRIVTVRAAAPVGYVSCCLAQGRDHPLKRQLQCLRARPLNQVWRAGASSR